MKLTFLFDDGKERFCRKMHCSHLMILGVAATLVACAGSPAKVAPVEAKVKAPASLEPKLPVVSQTARADFEEAMKQINNEQYDKAIELLKKVELETPGNAVASVNLALIYKMQDKLKEAEASLQNALKAEPDNPVALNEMALLNRKTGKMKEARQLYERALDKFPNYNMVHRNLGILCDLYLADFECALKHYVIYSNALPDDKTVKIWIADLQKRMGK